MTEILHAEVVRAREALWRVAEIRACRAREGSLTRPGHEDAVRIVRMVGADARNRWQPCTLIEPFDRVQPVAAATPPAPRIVSRARWMRTLAALAASATPPLRATCPASVASAQVALMPHQLSPLLTILGGKASRLLLADAVGLGKTIQAALILRELRARGCAERVLILVPPGLRDQWQQELLQRAGLRAEIVDAHALTARVHDRPPDLNPWSLPGLHIVSLDFMKQPRVHAAADAIAWDVLIADEAHALNQGTDRLAVVHRLARHSRYVLLLTATPHHGSDEAFAALCGIGCLDEDENDDGIAIVRRTRSAIGASVSRRIHVLRVARTEAERRVDMLLSRYAQRVDANASLALSVLIKRASSSASSLERSLRRRLALLESPDVSVGVRQPHLPFDADAGVEADDHPADREPGDDVLGVPGMRDRRIERAWLRLLVAAARNAARAESKPQALVRWLRRTREPALIYTEYRDTLEQLAHTLDAAAWRDGHARAFNARKAVDAASVGPRLSTIAVLHGGLGAEARREARRRFVSGEVRLLLTTDAAGEGLNLQQRCRVVINVELPWNPNRLEQRIGRVDRIGQARTVHALHLVAAGTAEEEMVGHLTGRVHQIAASLGDGPSVLTSEPAAPRDPSPPPVAHAVAHTWMNASSIVCEEAVAHLRLIRAAQGRAWRASTRRRHRRRPQPDPLIALEQRAPLVAIARRGSRFGQRIGMNTPGLLCVWRTRMWIGDRRTRPPLLTAMAIAFSRREHRPIRSFVTATLDRCRARLDALLADEVARGVGLINEREQAWRERLSRRDAAIAADLAASACAHRVVQPLLFDDIAIEEHRAGERRADDHRHALPSSSPPVHATAAGESALVLVMVLR